MERSFAVKMTLLNLNKLEVSHKYMLECINAFNVAMSRILRELSGIVKVVVV